MKDNFTKKNMKLWVEFPKIIIEKKFILGHMYYVCMQSTTEEKNKHFKCYQRKKGKLPTMEGQLETTNISDQSQKP